MKAAVGILVTLLLMSGCAVPEDEGGGFRLRVASQAIGQCQGESSTNGNDALPETVDRIRVRILSQDTEMFSQVYSTDAREARGELLVTNVPIGEDLTIEIYACEEGSSVAGWTGAVRNATVAEHQKGYPEIFLTKVGAFNCPGNFRIAPARTDMTVDLGVPRAFHNVLPLADGTLLVTGGLAGYQASAVSAATDTALLYDPGLGMFEKLPAMQFARVFHNTVPFSLQGREVVLIIGGAGKVRITHAYAAPFEPLSDGAIPDEQQVEAFDLATRTFAPVSGLPLTTRFLRAAASAGGRMVVSGGLDQDGEPSHILEILEGDTLIRSHMLVARVGHQMFPLQDGAILIWGGNTDGEPGNIAEVLKPGASETELMPVDGSAVPTAFHSMTRLGPTQFLVVGGHGLVAGKVASLPLSPASVYEVSLGEGKATVSPPQAESLTNFGDQLVRAFHSAALVGRDEVIIAGGHVGSQWFAPVDTMLVFQSGDEGFIIGTAQDPSGNDLLLPSQRLGHTASILADGTVLFTGGFADLTKPDQILITAEILNPPKTLSCE